MTYQVKDEGEWVDVPHTTWDDLARQAIAWRLEAVRELDELGYVLREFHPGERLELVLQEVEHG